MKKKSQKSRKKNKKKIIKIRITIFFAVIIAIIALVVYLIEMSKRPSKAMDTLSKYMAYINEENYEEMYNMLSNTSKNKTTKEDFIKKNEGVYSALEANNLSLSEMSEEDDKRKSKDSIYSRNANNSRDIKICKYYKTGKR